MKPLHPNSHDKTFEDRQNPEDMTVTNVGTGYHIVVFVIDDDVQLETESLRECSRH